MAKNILQIIPEIATGGAERIVYESAKAVIENGDNCFVFTNGGRMAGQFKEIGAQLIIGDAKTKNPFKILFSNPEFLKKIINKNNIDLVHVHSRAPAISAYLACKALKIPLVTTYHGIYPAKNAIKRFYNSFMTKADIVIANSNFTLEHLLKQHKINRAKTRLVYCGIDTEKFEDTAIKNEDCEKLLKQWNLKPQAKPFILLPARLTSWKGQQVLIDAAAILKSQNILPQFILAGDAQGRDEYKNQLLEQINKHNLNENVHLVGHCDNVPAAIKICDFVVTPSTKEEAFGMTNAEAQAMGKIAISSNIGGARETIVHNETGYLFEAGNANELADYIKTALSLSPEQKSQMQEKAKQRAKKLFSATDLHEKTLKIYDELLKA